MRNSQIILSTLTLVGAALLTWGPAAGQTLPGPFDSFNSWWLHPGLGTPGVQYDPPGDPGMICIDRDGDGSNESCYAVPEVAPSLSLPPEALANLRLTPTREILYAFGGTCGVSAGTMVYFFDVPAPPGALTLIDKECIDLGIGSEGFYDTGLCCDGVTDLACGPSQGLECFDGGGSPLLGVSPQRIAYVADAGNVFNGLVQIYWFDLSAGTHATTFPGFNQSLQLTGPQVSPYGDVAFVQHEVGGTSDSDYTAVDLCEADRLGQPLSSGVGGALFNLDLPIATAEMVDTGGGSYVVRVTHPDLPGGQDDLSFTPCSQTPPPALGACCKPDGTCAADVTATDCSTIHQGQWLGPDTDCADCVFAGACCLLDFGSCLPDMTEADCIAIGFGSPDWQGAGTTCDACPEPAALEITKTAPGTVAEGAQFTYTITYGNSGGIDASSVQVQETLPAAVTFVSATDTPGGVPANVVGSQVTWSVGTLPAGTINQQVTVRVRVGCNAPNNQIINSNYSITGSPGGTVAGAQVVTNVTPASPDPITMVLASVDLNGAPLAGGELVEHTITLTNTVAEQRDGITINGQFGGNVGTGFVSEFDSEVDAAGGTFTVSVNNAYFTWTGSIGPGATIDVIFRTLVEDCVPVNRDEEVLNNGSRITVRNPCNVEVGTTTPTDRFALVRPIRAELVALNLGPLQPMVFDSTAGLQAARAGSTVEFEMRLIEQENVGQASVTASLTIPTGITPDPPNNPLIAPPPGAGYNNGSRTITYSGPINAGQTISIRWNGIVDADGPCSTDLIFSGDAGGCANIRASLRLLKVPVLPTGSHLIGVDPQGGLWIVEPDDPATAETLLCLQGEYLTGLGRTPSGELWATGVMQIIRFNPVVEPPELEIFGDDFQAYELGIRNPADVAFDPTTPDPSFVFVGADNPPNTANVRRYTPAKPAGQRVEVILDDPVLGRLDRVSIDAEGMIASIGGGRLVRLDPTGTLPLAPGDYAQFDLTVDSDFGGLPGVRLAAEPANLRVDADGDYLVTVGTLFFEDFGTPAALPFRYTIPSSLLKIDRTSGTVGTPTGTPEIVVELLAGSVICQGTCPPNPPPADLSGAVFPEVPFGYFGSYRGAAIAPDCSVYFGSETTGLVAVLDRALPVSGYGLAAGGRGFDLEYVDLDGGFMLGDHDANCVLDLADLLGWDACLTGPDAGPVPPGCEVFDFNSDDDVDLDDFGQLQELMGP